MKIYTDDVDVEAPEPPIEAPEAPEAPLTPETVEPLPRPLPETESPEIALQAAYRAAITAYGDTLIKTRQARQRVAGLDVECRQTTARIGLLETRRLQAMDAADIDAIRTELANAQDQARDAEILLTNWRRVLKSHEEAATEALRRCHQAREKLIRWKIQQHMDALKPHLEALLPLWLVTAQDAQAHQLAAFFTLALPTASQTRQRLESGFAAMNLPFKIEALNHAVL